MDKQTDPFLLQICIKDNEIFPRLVILNFCIRTRLITFLGDDIFDCLYMVLNIVTFRKMSIFKSITDGKVCFIKITLKGLKSWSDLTGLVGVQETKSPNKSIK